MRWQGRRGAAAPASGTACDASARRGVIVTMDHIPRPLGALALIALLGAGAASAQTPTPQAPPVPAPHSLWFDAAALADDEFRAGVEAFTLGRFTLGASVGYSHTAHPRHEYELLHPPTAYPTWCDPRALMLCTEGYPYGYPSGDARRYRAWTAALAVRVYPASFAFRKGASRILVYAGAHANYRWSTWEDAEDYPCAYGCLPYPYVYAAGSAPVRPPLRSPADSVIVMRPNPYPYPVTCCGSPVRHSRGGLEPGLDVGVRFLPFGPLFVEAGGRFTLATADDEMRRTKPGDVESRLVLAAGIAW